MKEQRQFRTHAARIILDCFEKMMSQEEGTLLGEDIEYLHRMRVASRRMRARLEDFAVLFPSRRPARIRKQIRRLTRRLGAVRDVDVFEQLLLKELPVQGTSQKGRSRRRPGVPESLLAAVANRRAELRRELTRFFQVLHDRGTIDRIRRYFSAESARRPPEDALRDPMKSFARQVIPPRYKALEFYRHKRFQGPAGLGEIHKLRIRAKKLRYSMEIFEMFFGDEFSKLVAGVRHMQDAAGRVHDCEIHVELIRQLTKEGSVKGRECRPLMRYCDGQRQQATAEFRRLWREFWGLDLASKLNTHWAGASAHIAG